MTSTSNTAMGARALQIVHVRAVGSDESMNRGVAGILATLGTDISVQVVDDPPSLIERLDHDHFDAIVVAHSRELSEAISALDFGLAFAEEYPVIVLIDEEDEELTQSLLADGAVECLSAATLQPGEFELAVRRAVARHQGVQKKEAARPQPAATARMIGPPVQPMVRREPTLVPAPSSLANPIHPDSLRRRSRAGALIGVALLVAVGIGAHRLWTIFFRFQAYGVVVGRAIEVSTPWEGQIKYVHVEEGQMVRQGDLLITTENLTLHRELESLDDELAVANSELNAKVSELKWNASYFHDVNARTSTTLYETWGQLLNEREMVTKLRAAFARAEKLIEKKAITRDDYEKIKYELRGRIHKVEKLTRAVAELRRQVESAEGLSDLGTDQLTPLYAKITAIKGKRERLRSQIADGQLRSPINGTVLRRNGFVGEHCKPGEPIVTVVEETSARVVVYYSQKSQHIPKVGDTVAVQMPPHARLLTCVVERIGDSFEPPPKQIARHYLANEKLLPLRMKPTSGLQQGEMRLGAVVMLPRPHSAFLGWSL